MANYEVHFFRADGTPGLRIFTLAATDEEALLSVRKMQSAEFTTVKVWRTVDRVMVQPAKTPPAPASLTAGERFSKT